MNFDKIVDRLSRSVDPNAVLQQELEEVISPVEGKIEKLEKKIDLLILEMREMNENLKLLKPIYDLMEKIPIFRI